MDYEIYNDDCLVKMQDIPDNSIQLICTDPPYASTDLQWDKLPDINELFKEWKRILTDNGTIVMTMAFPAAIEFLNAGKDMFKQDLVWCKRNKTNYVNAHNAHLRQHENIFVFSKGSISNNSLNRMTYNPQGLILYNKTKVCGADKGHIGLGKNYEGNTYIQEYTNYPTTLININGNQHYTKHSTEKPIELMEYLICTYSNEEDKVLDPFAGSGTTGVACLKSKRIPVLIERDEHWYEVSKERIQAVHI
jgi:site-specific DNA-methyltransferase (adenine-specific)